MKFTFKSLVILVVAALVGWLVTGHLFGALSGGALVFGAGTITNPMNSDIVRQLAAWGVTDPCGGLLRRVIAKTADYTILDPFTATTGGDPSGTIFTNRGAVGAVIFTLPAPVPRLAGVSYEFQGIADQSINVKTATADTLIALNDLTADSVEMSTGTKLIGSRMRAECDGTSWIAYGVSIGTTMTVNT